MYRRDGQLVVSASDLTGFLECEHLSRLSLDVVGGARSKPVSVDPMTGLVAERGMEHERRYADRLRADGLHVVEISPAGQGRDELFRAQADTLAAMQAGADVVYQASFFDGLWRGHADFLEKRTDRPSRLGSWSYDVADTKLARRIKVAAILQMAVYGDLLTTLQGQPPERLIVITGDGRRESFGFADAAAYARTARRRFLDALDEEAFAAAYPNPHCPVCPWRETCKTAWQEADDLSLVAFMRRDHARLLRESGIRTVRQLGTTPAADLPAGIGRAAGQRLAQQARGTGWSPRVSTQLARKGRPATCCWPRRPGCGRAPGWASAVSRRRTRSAGSSPQWTAGCSRCRDRREPARPIPGHGRSSTWSASASGSASQP